MNMENTNIDGQSGSGWTGRSNAKYDVIFNAERHKHGDRVDCCRGEEGEQRQAEDQGSRSVPVIGPVSGYRRYC